MVLYYQPYITIIPELYYTMNILRFKPKSALLYILEDWLNFPSQKRNFEGGKFRFWGEHRVGSA
jgi:hypothetical protein